MKTIAAMMLFALACGPAAPVANEPAPVETPPPAGDARAALAMLEEQLLGAPSVEIAVKVQASGAHTAELGGTITILADNKSKLDFQGTFDGQPVDLHYQGDGSQPHLNEALVLGFTRMGALHNVAVLATGGSAPDHADGGVVEWVKPVDPRWLALKRGQTGSALQFGVSVAGESRGTAVLWLGEDGLPYKRTQSVQFSTGAVDVEEHYHVSVK